MDAGEGIEKRRRMAEEKDREQRNCRKICRKIFKDGNISTRMEAATHYMKMAST